MITQERLKEVLCYDPKTGVFTREGEIVGYDNGDGYLKAYIDNKSYYLHRLAWLYIYGNNAKIVDHKDQNKKNNSISNLREVSNSENLHNRGAPKNSTTGHKGVCFVKSRNKYVAYKTIMYKRKHLGIFDTLEEAVQCRKLFEESL
jgi:HNH endonuclease/AP2 domain